MRQWQNYRALGREACAPTYLSSPPSGRQHQVYDCQLPLASTDGIFRLSTLNFPRLNYSPKVTPIRKGTDKTQAQSPSLQNEHSLEQCCSLTKKNFFKLKKNSWPLELTFQIKYNHETDLLHSR